MRVVLSSILVLAVAVGLAACGGQAPAAEFSKEDAAQIRQLLTDFVAAYNAKDVEKIGTLFSATGTIMPPNRSTLRGVEMVKTYFEGRLNEEGATDLVFDDAMTVDGHGPLAYVANTYQLVLKPAGGAEERYRGKAISIFRKLANQWRFELQMMSSDLPPAALRAPAAETEKK
jgi:ketosteroid isomerase-like protein